MFADALAHEMVRAPGFARRRRHEQPLRRRSLGSRGRAAGGPRARALRERETGPRLGLRAGARLGAGPRGAGNREPVRVDPESRHAVRPRRAARTSRGASSARSRRASRRGRRRGTSGERSRRRRRARPSSPPRRLRSIEDPDPHLADQLGLGDFDLLLDDGALDEPALALDDERHPELDLVERRLGDGLVGVLDDDGFHDGGLASGDDEPERGRLFGVLVLFLARELTRPLLRSSSV